MSHMFSKPLSSRLLAKLLVTLGLLITVLASDSTSTGGEENVSPWLRPYEGPTRTNIDATTLRHKVLCGYQGWFRCPGDPAGEGWRHWSRDPGRITPQTLTFEMWPDMSDYTAAEKYVAPGFTYPDGKPAHLFSSANTRTIKRHFEWMREYGIDGAFLQRFLVNIGKESFDRVLYDVRSSANRSGRVFAIFYDMTAMPEDQVFDRLTTDWKRLVDEAKITQDPRYLHHNGKPVLLVWGFYSDRFGPGLAHRIIDFFKSDGEYEVTLIGGGDWRWRSEQDADWSKVFRRFDVISPWNVGNVSDVQGEKQATTHYWEQDIAEAKRAGMGYLPVIYPGFGWSNLKGEGSESATIPRLGGRFFWRQFSTAAELGVEMAYVATFDEVDEATAIFKVGNTPPEQGRFETFEGLPSDWYLRLTGEGSKLIRGERSNVAAIPIEP